MMLKRPDKELWDGTTKQHLALHMANAAPFMLPHLMDRPLSLVRAPEGIGAQRFFQKDAHHLKRYVRTCTYDDVDYVLAEGPEDLVRLADQAVVELHGWTSLCSAPDKPDRMVFDLDPPSREDFDKVRRAARDLCSLVEKRRATPFPMLTGSKGIHIVVPLLPEAPFEDVIAFTTAVAKAMVRHDETLTMEIRKAKRKGRIFVDTLRNRPRQTAVMPWSPRARPGAPISWPITVEDLGDPALDPQRAHIGDKLGESVEAWKGFFGAAVPLSRMA